jgi:hypothetical protein
MRALCGAIITAGALIGLGLAALGVGQRYADLARPTTGGGVLLRQWTGNDDWSGPATPDKEHRVAYVKFSEMDLGLSVPIVVLILAALAGLATAYIGLAFHHHRRVQELEHMRRHVTGTTHTPAAP